jgi:hypothetical protein
MENRGLQELANLSQQQYSPQISGEAGMNTPVQVSSNKAESLVTDISKLVGGIEQFAKVKYDLSNEATKQMAIDHKLSFIETKNSIMSIPEQELSLEDKQKYISEATGNFQKLSAEHIKDDSNAQQIYDEVFTNGIRETYSNTMARLDNAIYDRDMKEQVAYVGEIADKGNIVKPSELLSVANEAIKGKFTDKDKVLTANISGIQKQIDTTASSDLKNGLLYEDRFIKKNDNGTYSFDTNSLEREFNSMYGNYGTYKNGKFILDDSISSEIENDEVIKNEILTSFDKYLAKAQNKIDSRNNSIKSTYSDEAYYRLKERLEKTKEDTDKNGQNIAPELDELETMIYNNVSASKQSTLRGLLNDVNNNNQMRSYVLNEVSEYFNTTQADTGSSTLFDIFTSGKKIDIKGKDGSINTYDIDSGFAKAELNKFYVAKDEDIFNNSDVNTIGQNSIGYIQRQVKIGELSPMVKKSINIVENNLGNTSDNPEELMKNIQLYGTIATAKGKDLSYFNLLSSRVQQTYNKALKDNPKINSEDLHKKLLSTMAETKRWTNEQGYISNLKAWGVNAVSKLESGYYKGLAPDREASPSVISTFNSWLTRNGIKINSESEYNDRLSSMVASTEGTVMSIASSWSVPFLGGGEKKASSVLIPEGVSEKMLQDTVEHITEVFRDDDINNYTFENFIDSNGDIAIAMYRIGSNSEDKFTLGKKDIYKISTTSSSESIKKEFKTYINSLISKER